jgi:penicillin-binding protein 1B
MGRDDNKPTTLFGASGALRAWRYLFAKLPTTPLSAAPGPGLEMAWVNPADGKRTEPQCQGAQQVPVVAGSLPAETQGCFWQGVQNLFGGSDNPSPAGSALPAASSSSPIRN